MVNKNLFNTKLQIKSFHKGKLILRGVQRAQIYVGNNSCYQCGNTIYGTEEKAGVGAGAGSVQNYNGSGSGTLVLLPLS
jgi:hypothetical protein